MRTTDLQNHYARRAKNATATHADAHRLSPAPWHACLGYAAYGCLSGCVATVRGCVATVRGPAHVTVPQHIYLAESGSHGSLAIPTSEHEIVEWSFCDWYWYALGQQNYWRSPMILFWPSKGTLAKKTISYPEIISPELLARQLGAKKAWPLVVEKNAALALHAQLEE